MLELGCGDGGNLLPMALQLPGARFHGVDASGGAIAGGRALIAQLETQNVSLEAAAIEAVEVPPAGFDYIIAHGVYSWCPRRRDRLLALCGVGLSDHGVAYVSYNALPGGRLRQALRDMLVAHTAALEYPKDQIEQSRELLRFLLSGLSEEHDLGALVRREVERALERSDATLFNDDPAPL